MLFENIKQYDKAKKALIENEGNVNLVFNILKKDQDFKTLSEGELRSSLSELNEGLGERIVNFIGGAFGGDISKIKTVLTQMKEQELKFNREENEIYNQFYSLLQDKKQLERSKNNPNYDSLSKDITAGMNALNTRMKELTKTHDEIFNALEEKVKSLVGDNSRKKRYFNAQRATDVLETKNDRYEKIKAITAKSAKRSQELENFFGVDVEGTKKEAEKAAAEAEKKVDTLTNSQTAPTASTTSSTSKNVKISFDESPEKELFQKLEKIKNDPGGFYAKRKNMEDLEEEILIATNDNAFKNYSEEKKKSINHLYLLTKQLYRELEREATKIK
jgi:hypothetical protein